MRVKVEFKSKPKGWQVALYPVTVPLYYLLYFGTMPLWLSLYLWRKKRAQGALARAKPRWIRWD